MGCWVSNNDLSHEIQLLRNENAVRALTASMDVATQGSYTSANSKVKKDKALIWEND